MKTGVVAVRPWDLVVGLSVGLVVGGIEGVGVRALGVIPLARVKEDLRD